MHVCMPVCVCVCASEIYIPLTQALLSLLQPLHLSGSPLSLSYCLWSFSLFSLTSVFLTLQACMPIFLCRCFDRQGYCSRGWCLDTAWHYATPWAHAQIREDIRNPSLHVSFNHTGWRRNVFMDLIVEQIHCMFESVCEHVCALTKPFYSLEYTWHIREGCVSPVCRTQSHWGKKRERTKGRREQRGGKLKVSCSHKVTLNAFLITYSFHLLLSPQHKCVRTQRSRKLFVESEVEEGLMVNSSESVHRCV